MVLLGSGHTNYLLFGSIAACAIKLLFILRLKLHAISHCNEFYLCLPINYKNDLIDGQEPIENEFVTLWSH